jgi:hypothetical protein
MSVTGFTDLAAFFMFHARQLATRRKISVEAQFAVGDQLSSGDAA